MLHADKLRFTIRMVGAFTHDLFSLGFFWRFYFPLVIRQCQIKSTNRQFSTVVVVDWQGFEIPDNIIWCYSPRLFQCLSFNEDCQRIAAGAGIEATFQFKSYLTDVFIPYGKIQGNCIPAISCFFPISIRLFKGLPSVPEICHGKKSIRMVLPEIKLSFHFLSLPPLILFCR